MVGARAEGQCARTALRPAVSWPEGSHLAPKGVPIAERVSFNVVNVSDHVLLTTTPDVRIALVATPESDHAVPSFCACNSPTTSATRLTTPTLGVFSESFHRAARRAERASAASHFPSSNSLAGLPHTRGRHAPHHVLYPCTSAGRRRPGRRQRPDLHEWARHRRCACRSSWPTRTRELTGWHRLPLLTGGRYYVYNRRAFPERILCKQHIPWRGEHAHRH
jgi:hypothetical protein